MLMLEWVGLKESKLAADLRLVIQFEQELYRFHQIPVILEGQKLASPVSNQDLDAITGLKKITMSEV